MATNCMDLLEEAFDDHPSLSASLEDFEHNENRSPMFALPSQHSGFKSDESEAGAETNSEEPWSPPAWRTQCTGGGWYRHQPYPFNNPSLKPSVSASRSRDISPHYESAKEEDGDLTVPANIPLPRGSLSPVKERSPSPSPVREARQEFETTFEQPNDSVPIPEPSNNCAQPCHVPMLRYH